MKNHAMSTACLCTALLIGCAKAPAEDQAADPTDPCGAQSYTSLLGSSLAAVTLPADLNDRVTRPGDAVTTDYDPTRLNIELNDAGTVVGLSCG